MATVFALLRGAWILYGPQIQTEHKPQRPPRTSADRCVARTELRAFGFNETDATRLADGGYVAGRLGDRSRFASLDESRNT